MARSRGANIEGMPAYVSIPRRQLLGASAYDHTLLDLAKSQVEGVWLYIPAAMYLGEDRSSNREVDLFQTWLKRTHPNDPVDLFSVAGAPVTKRLVPIGIGVLVLFVVWRIIRRRP